MVVDKVVDLVVSCRVRYQSEVFEENEYHDTTAEAASPARLSDHECSDCNFLNFILALTPITLLVKRCAILAKFLQKKHRLIKYVEIVCVREFSGFGRSHA